MEIKEKLQEISKLFSAWNYDQAKKLNDEILKQDPNNIYAKKYDTLINSKIGTQTWNKIPKVMWKQLKCPHCVSRIPNSSLTEQQQEKIKKWEYNNLEIKCPYCNTKFILQKKKEHSLLWIKIWDTATIDNKKYRAVWYVKYVWTRTTYVAWNRKSWGRLEYLEWMLLWEDNNYKYFSESIAYYHWSREVEFELSEKHIPDWKIEPNYDKLYVSINWNKSYFEEVDKIKVSSVYWENSKSYTIWEDVKLYDTGSIVIEKESAWTQSEVWIYKGKTIYKSDAAKLFGKTYKPTYFWGNSKNAFTNDSTKAIPITVFILFFLANFVSIVTVLLLITAVILIYVLYSYREKLKKETKIALYWVLLIPILWLAIIKPIVNLIIETKTPISLENIDISKKYKIEFASSDLTQKIQTSTKTYDYGGVRTYYSQNEWLKFSIASNEDMKIIEKIDEIIKTNTSDSDSIKKIFTQPIYKLK